MASRLEFQTKLENILGSRNVYFQPPENYKISYPCIIYHRRPRDVRYADDVKYRNLSCYEVQLIKRDSDTDDIFEALHDLRYSRHERSFIMDNLSHDNFVIYY